MRRVFFLLVVAVLIGGGGVTCARGAGLGDKAESPVPCIDTTDDLTIWIQVAGNETMPPQRVYGKFTSWDPQTTTIGFQSALSQTIEQIPLKSIRLEPSRPHPAAQVALPTLVSRGIVSRTYPASELSVVDGVLKFPECRFMSGDHRLVFAGALTVAGGEIHLQGEVFEAVPPRGGDGRSTGPKGG
ncbi:hypothetical protein Despr_0601 [Desulfobulbus propionicus DSM 2032]|jgi:hypothetical protein|uniref:Uncharacterized protein n=1 Tax=Desulfobulbus propionicus (strain ATCC 33891 / DSM 2032 / VKM B-1956 / 1pr3) TaxID=577650 RepID=A0A7U4DN76_DESPD|nr:hypothetical protein [Desulfobulbus propionicus]ADW16777.1 hypothetical protein Despr_0601 [Desulfobulbus propionicus DSM 2032]